MVRALRALSHRRALPGRTAGRSGARHDDEDEIEFYLTNLGVDPGARARVRFRDGDHQEFEVKVKDLAPGFYMVAVGDMSVGTFEVGQDDDESEGRLKIEDEPLGFDPRGKIVEVLADPSGPVFFRGLFPTDAGEAHRRVKIEEDFGSTGADPDASGEARLKSRHGKTRFQVRVRDLPVGTYDLLVGGTKVADLVVGVDDDLVIGADHEDDGGDDNDTEGKVKFDSRSAHDPGGLLTFDPLCQRLDVGQGATTFLTIAQFGSSEVTCP